MLTDIQFISSLIFIVIVARYIHRWIKGDLDIVSTELISEGYLRDHLNHVTGTFYVSEIKYKSGRIKYKKTKLK